MAHDEDPRLSIQVVTWNSAAVLDACLESVGAQTCRDFEVIVLDNASRDDSADRAERGLARARERGIEARVLREKENLGFCGGHNRALAEGRGDLVLLLNPDATLPSDFVEKAIALADARPNEVGLFAPRILLPDGRLDSTGLVLDRFRRAWDRGAGESARDRFMIEGDVFGCTGAAALLRRAMLDDVALDGKALDEKLFAYCDDADLSWRARLRGWRCLYAPSLVVTHGRAGRNGLRRAGAQPRRALEQTLMVRNRLLVIAKCEPASSLLAAAPRLALFELVRITLLATRAPAVLRAYPQALRLVPAVLRDRRRIQAAAALRARATRDARREVERVGITPRPQQQGEPT